MTKSLLVSRMQFPLGSLCVRVLSEWAELASE